ncbi:hypothetical protein VCHE46_2486B, partial [Vibrio cholerae HE-46]
IQAGKTH